MELDKRIKEGKRPLTCFDTDEASKFVDEKGYFSDCLYNFQNLDNCSKSILHCIDDKREDSKDYIFNDGKYYCRFFLPAEWVKEPEKKYRPFSLEEFWRFFDFGDGVCFRRKGQDTAEFSMFLGYKIDSDGNRDEIPGEGKVNLGGNRYTLAELFEYYEMQLDDEWQPFGIEVEEK